MIAARYNAPMLFHLRDPNLGDEEREDFELFKQHPYVSSWEDYSGPAEGNCHEHTGYGVIFMKKKEWANVDSNSVVSGEH
jgi:hypothetical protein